jgi:hypothetical protein
MFEHFTLNKLLVLVTTIGYALLLLDTTIEYWNTFKQEIMTFIPLIFSLFVLALGLIVVISWKEKFIYWFQILLFTLFTIAATGLYFHIEEEKDEYNLTVEERELEENEAEKPMLAPVSFTCLEIFGLLGTM